MHAFSEKLVKIPPPFALPSFAFSYTFCSEKLLGDRNVSGWCSGAQLSAGEAVHEASDAQGRSTSSPPGTTIGHGLEQGKGQALLLIIHFKVPQPCTANTSPKPVRGARFRAVPSALREKAHFHKEPRAPLLRNRSREKVRGDGGARLTTLEAACENSGLCTVPLL